MNSLAGPLPTLFAACCILVFAFPDTTFSGVYAFDRVTSSSAPLTHYSVPSINNQGDVAFALRQSSTPSAVGVYVGNTSGTVKVYSPSARFSISPLSRTAPWINDNGDIAFAARFDEQDFVNGPERVAFVSNGSLTKVSVGTAFGNPSLSNDGIIVYEERRGNAQFVVRHSISTAVTTDLATSEPAFGLINPVISRDSSVIGYGAAKLSFGFPEFYSIFTVINGVTSTIDSPLMTLEDGGLSVNNSGFVSFYKLAFGIPNPTNIYVGDGGPLSTVIDDRQNLSTIPGMPSSINNSGDVVYLAALSLGLAASLGYDGANGIFDGPSSVFDKVIRTGDPLDGSTVLELGFGPAGLNDRGQISFSAMLADGRSGIYVATAVPEVSSMLLVGSCLLVGFIAVRRARAVYSQV